MKILTTIFAAKKWGTKKCSSYWTKIELERS